MPPRRNPKRKTSAAAAAAAADAAAAASTAVAAHKRAHTGAAAAAATAAATVDESSADESQVPFYDEKSQRLGARRAACMSCGPHPPSYPKEPLKVGLSLRSVVKRKLKEAIGFALLDSLMDLVVAYADSGLMVVGHPFDEDHVIADGSGAILGTFPWRYDGDVLNLEDGPGDYPVAYLSELCQFAVFDPSPNVIRIWCCESFEQVARWRMGPNLAPPDQMLYIAHRNWLAVLIKTYGIVVYRLDNGERVAHAAVEAPCRALRMELAGPTTLAVLCTTSEVHHIRVLSIPTAAAATAATSIVSWSDLELYPFGNKPCPTTPQNLQTIGDNRNAATSTSGATASLLGGRTAAAPASADHPLEEAVGVRWLPQHRRLSVIYNTGGANARLELWDMARRDCITFTGVSGAVIELSESELAVVNAAGTISAIHMGAGSCQQLCSLEKKQQSRFLPTTMDDGVDEVAQPDPTFFALGNRTIVLPMWDDDFRSRRIAIVDLTHGTIHTLFPVLSPYVFRL